MAASAFMPSNTLDADDILMSNVFDETALLRAFAARREQRRFLARSVLLCVGVFVYITYAMLDTAIEGHISPELFYLRYGIVIPLLVGIAVAFVKGWFRGRERITFVICMTLAVGSVFCVHILFGKPLARTVPPGLTGMVFLVWLVYLPSFRQTLGIAVAAILALALYSAVSEMNPMSLFVNGYFICLYFTLLITGMFFLEATERGHETFRKDIGKAFDILRWSESRAVDLYRDAKKAEKAKDEFLAVVSHELRTPMNAIIGFSEIMSKQMFGRIEPPQYHEYAIHIQDSGQQLLALINDILDVSRAGLDRIAFEARPFDMEATLVSALATCAPEAARAGVRVERAGSATGPVVLRGDEGRMTQAMVNILGNAIKFSHRGGTVRASLDRDGEGTVRVTVSDNGIGIAEEDIGSVTQPFQQAQGAFARDKGGLGLGLAICAIVARAHGGELRIESLLDRGTTVSLVLPAPAADASAPDTTDAPAPESLSA